MTAFDWSASAFALDPADAQRRGGLVWLDQLELGAPEDCWRWLGYHDKNGYAKAAYGLAHRLIYAFVHGTTPTGHLHHACHNPGCVNPRHLRVMSPSEHTLLHHPRECEHDDDLRYHSPRGKSYCRPCAALNARKYRRRKKEARLAA